MALAFSFTVMNALAFFFIKLMNPGEKEQKTGFGAVKASEGHRLM